MMGTLLNFIDEVTKQHTVKDMPKDVTKDSFDKYIAEVMKFINTVTGGNADRCPAPMQMGALTNPEGSGWYPGAEAAGFTGWGEAWAEPTQWGGRTRTHRGRNLARTGCMTMRGLTLSEGPSYATGVASQAISRGTVSAGPRAAGVRGAVKAVREARAKEDGERPEEKDIRAAVAVTAVVELAMQLPGKVVARRARARTAITAVSPATSPESARTRTVAASRR